MSMTTTINLSVPPGLLKQIDRLAKAEFRSRSEFFRQAVRVYLERKARERNEMTEVNHEARKNKKYQKKI